MQSGFTTSLGGIMKRVKVESLFALYDFWVGFYWDADNRWLYFLPFPCLGLIFKFDNQEKSYEDA
jgi:hypothetical protein